MCNTKIQGDDMKDLNLDSIKGLINKEELEKNIEVNKDSYGGACVKVAINVMKHLDNFKDEFNIGYHPDLTTPHGIICKCDDQGGITGAMAGFVRNIVAKCYVSGWKFYLADLLSQYNIEDEEKVSGYIRNVVKAELTNESEAKEFVESLINRFRLKNDK